MRLMTFFNEDVIRRFFHHPKLREGDNNKGRSSRKIIV